MATKTLTEQFISARMVSVPLIVGRTPDPAAFVATLAAPLMSAATPRPVVEWDVVNGVRGYNPEGLKVAAEMNQGQDGAISTANPTDFIRLAATVPAGTCIFMHNAQAFWTDPSVMQGIWNVRDPFKSNKRTLVMVTPGGAVPASLALDVLVLEEPLPSVATLEDIVRKVYQNAEKSGVKTPTPDVVKACATALTGLPTFQSDNVASMNITPTGIDVESLWEAKYTAIEQVKGLSVYRGRERYADIGGIPEAKRFFTLLMNGDDPFTSVIFMDEIEKALAGTAGDTSGTSQDQHQAVLTEMQDTEAYGALLIGHPGCSKSLLAKATGNEAGRPCISFDLGACKGSLVGQSEENIRTALRTIRAMAGGRPLWIATCNSIGNLSPELRRRFTLGTYMFELPTAEEQAAIWPIYFRKYGLKKQAIPSVPGWTGAEIKQAAFLAKTLNVPLAEAVKFVVPLVQAAPDRIEKLRRESNGRFLSANTPGVYTMPNAAAPTSQGRELTFRSDTV